MARQVEAIKNLKIDKITVWDSGGGNGKGSSTANFLSGMIKSLPPLHEVAGMAGVELPGYLGNSSSDEKTNGGSSHDGVSKWKAPPPAPTKQA